MFNIGFAEFLVIGVIALVVIGPKQLPEVARVVGRLLVELKKATQELSGGLLEVTNEVKASINETKQEIINEGQKVVDSVIDDPHQHESHSDEVEEDSVKTEQPSHGDHGKSNQ
jgi:Tat protein translocase TatB subunit